MPPVQIQLGGSGDAVAGQTSGERVGGRSWLAGWLVRAAVLPVPSGHCESEVCYPDIKRDWAGRLQRVCEALSVSLSLGLP